MQIIKHFLSHKTVLIFLTVFKCGMFGCFAQNTQDSLQNDPYKALIEKSFEAGNKGEYNLAEKFLQEAINLQPDNPFNSMLMNNIAGIQQLEGKDKEAIDTYSKALSLMPDEQTIRHNRALLYAKMGMDKEAISDYSILISRAPKNEVYLYQRAMLYMANKKYTSAEIDLNEIIKNNDNSLRARMGYAWLETMRGNYDAAERLYAYLISKLSDNSEVYEGRARMYFARNMNGFALRDVNKAFDLSGNKVSPTLYILRGEINLKLGDKKSAAKDFEVARKIDPKVAIPQIQ